ncbi:hypothetical protein [Salmonella enterica]|uniref:hypothetical protein n=1 Tax=Salmonella enterica TaxID=28901 RepID=UPI001ED9C09B|nr:hypothetical protein [Salmonella enterica]
MHALAPYLFRCYNPNAAREQRYSALSNIRDLDLLDILYDFIQQYNAGYILSEETKQVFRFNEIVRDENNREIYGWFGVWLLRNKN